MLKAKQALLFLFVLICCGSAAALPPTVTELNVSPSTTVTAGTPVQLEANVSFAAIPVTPGQVLFCISTAAHCTDQNLIGQAQLNEGGEATLTVTLGAGTYSVAAEFVGTTSHPAATSTPVTITVTPNSSYVSSTSLAATGSIGDYTLTGTVTGGGRVPPSGTLNFVDTTNSNAVVATASLSPAGPPYQIVSAPTQQIDVGGHAISSVAADFNNDGITDLAVLNRLNNSISIYFGVGDGTFNMSAATYTVGNGAEQVVAGDFNNDGLVDLAVTNEEDGTVGVLLNQGENTFATEVTYPIGEGTQPYGLAVGDFNHDGNLDLAVVLNSLEESTLEILEGAGNGTFQLEPQTLCDTATIHTGSAQTKIHAENITCGTLSYPLGSNSTYVVTADFNNDGNSDLAVINQNSNSVSLLDGNGDGTFDLQEPLGVGELPNSIAVGDINGDGYPDIIVSVLESNEADMLLSNGTGGFGFSYVPYVGIPGFVSVADFNGDGNLDVAVGDSESDRLSVFFGDGAGDLGEEPITFNLGPSPQWASIADWNGDGLPDLAIVNEGGATSVSIALGEQIATAVAEGVSVSGAGNHLVQADFAGDAIHIASNSSTQTLEGTVVTTTVLAAAPNPSSFGQSVTLTATVTPIPVGAPAGTVSFDNGATLLGTGSVNPETGVATLVTSALPVGTDALVAVYGGDNAGDQASTSATFNQTVNQAATATAITSTAPDVLVAGQSTTITAAVTPAPSVMPYGSVSFYDGATLLGAGNVDATGHASVITTGLTAGTNALTAVYNGTTDYAGSTSPVDNVTALAATTTALVASPSPATFGSSVGLTATITPTPTGAPLGSVSFYNGETLVGTATAGVSGTAVLNTNLPVGTLSLTAVYAGNAGFNGSTSSPTSLTVNTAPTTTVVAGTPNPVTFGQSATLTATISPVPDGPPYGTVTFFNGATQIGSPANVNASGVASVSSSSLPVGTLGLTGVYSGNTDYASSESTSFSYVVNQIATTTTLAAAPNPVVAGQTETLTATISPIPSGSSLGTVTFFNGATQVGVVNVNDEGVAVFTTTSLPAGVLPMTATYSGNANFVGSTSTAQSLTVLAATTTVLNASPSPATFGQTVILTATVTPAPTGSSLGTVNFHNGETQIGSGTVSATGVATFTSNSLAVASYTLTAVYSGNTAFATSTSTAVPLTVNVAPTTTVLTASPSPVTFGQSVTLTATVTPTPTGSALGSVIFTNGETVLGTVSINASGVATLASTTLPPGTLSLTATYSGNTDFGESTSTVTSLVVNTASTTISMTASPNPAVLGQSVTLSATITPAPTGSSLGTVSFFNGPTLVGTGNVGEGGTASITTANLPAGVLSLTAVYSGNTDFGESTSSAQSLTVLQTTTTVLGGSPNPSTFTQTVTLTATITPAPTGSSLGTVNFMNGSTQVGTAGVAAGGVATLTTSTLAVGTYSLTAVYSGNTLFNTSTSVALPLTVNLAPTTTVLAGTPSPATFGQSVTLTATVSPAPTGATLGTVVFFDGSTQLGTGSVSASGAATFSSTSLPAGALSLTAVYSGNAGYATSTATAFSLTVNTTYEVTAPETPYTVTQGGSVNVNVTVPPLGGAYNSVVTMSATGLPPGATATFTPPTVTPGASGAPTAMTIQLAPLASGLNKPGPAAPWTDLFSTLSKPAFGSPLAALLAAVMLFLWPRRRRWAKPLQFAAVILMAGLIGSALAGCSGGFLRPPSTQPGSFTVTVTGTSGAVHQSTTVTVVVQ